MSEAAGAPEACPVGGERPLSAGEVALARSIFGDAIDYDKVTIRRRKWAFFQPTHITMAPRGHIHFHPLGSAYCDDFTRATVFRQALLVHELTHVWQVQTRGAWFLLLNRMPWARYDYALKPGWRLEQYGIEQQARIVEHVFLLRNGVSLPGAPPLSTYAGVLPFTSG